MENKKEAKGVLSQFDFFSKNQKGQSMSVNTIIMIILGLAILVLLILGFALGWGKIFPFLNSTNNVDQVKQLCQTACATQLSYDFCSLPRELKINKNSMIANCSYFAAQDEVFGTKLSIEDCSTISCA